MAVGMTYLESFHQNLNYQYLSMDVRIYYKYGNYLVCQEETKDGIVNSHRGPDKTEGKNVVAETTGTSWLSTPALVFGKGGFKKK